MSETWYDHAACKGMGHLMFPERGNAQMAARAIAICDTCTVKAECLNSALETEERFGVWGGLAEKRRRQIRIPSACGTRLAYDRGCRCEACSAAYAKYLVDRKNGNHGTRSNYVRGCRCEDCTTANSQFHQRRRVKRLQDSK